MQGRCCAALCCAALHLAARIPACRPLPRHALPAAPPPPCACPPPPPSNRARCMRKTASSAQLSANGGLAGVEAGAAPTVEVSGMGLAPPTEGSTGLLLSHCMLGCAPAPTAPRALWVARALHCAHFVAPPALWFECLPLLHLTALLTRPTPPPMQRNRVFRGIQGLQQPRRACLTQQAGGRLPEARARTRRARRADVQVMGGKKERQPGRETDTDRQKQHFLIFFCSILPPSPPAGAGRGLMGRRQKDAAAGVG